MKYLNLLTGLRGLAAFIVFVAHSADRGLLPGIMGWGFGQVGVMLFFVLSGFLMSHLYIQKEFSYEHVRGYALARIGRVVPLFLVTLILSYIISNYIYHDFTYDFQDNLDFVFALLFIKAPYVFWTIPVEIQFYFAFVMFWWLYKKKTASPALLFLFILVCLVPSALVYWIFGKFPDVFSAYSFAFFIGVVTALFYRTNKDSKSLISFANKAGLPILLLLFINLPELRLDMGWVLHENIFIRVWLDPLNWLLVYGLFICALYGSKSLSFLTWKPFVFLGEISYGVYLLHYPFLEHLRLPYIGVLGNTILAFIFTLTLAYLSYRFFERPVSDRIRNSTLFKSVDSTKKITAH